MSKKKSEIVLIHDNGGDWMGIYVDGVLKREDHNIDADDALAVLGIEFRFGYVDLEDGGRLSRKLEDLNVTLEEDK